MSAPKNPAPLEEASAPPTKPTASPGLSAMLMAMKPASTGSMKPKEMPPMSMKVLAYQRFEPKLPGLAGSKVSRRKARAIRMPPPMTNGSMCETPFIRCL